jgi:SLOG in TRPM, prokaryote
VRDAGADRRALAAPFGQPQELDALRRRDGIEPARGLLVRSVVDEDERADVLEHAADERRGGHVAVRRHDGGDCRASKGLERRRGRLSGLDRLHPPSIAAPLKKPMTRWEDRVVDEAFFVPLGAGAVTAVRVSSPDELDAAARLLALPEDRPVLVVAGGAAGMSASDADQLRTVVEDVLVPLVCRLGATVVDGATDTGVMQVVGRARARAEQPFPLVGVVVDVLAATDDGSAGETPLEPNHTHVVLVPGTDWGDEIAWLARLVTVLAGSARSVTVLANGGDVAWADVEQSVADGRPVVALAGTGRAADQLAAAVRGERRDERAQALAASGLIHAVDAPDHDELKRLVDDLLGGS